MTNGQAIIQSKTMRPARKPFGHAIVIGSSIAGLTTARVLSDYFDHVTLIDRDRLPDTPDFRSGTPQARHAHILPLRGQKILEEQFPGLTAELMTKGAVSIQASSEMAFFIAGGWHEVRHHTALFSTTCSRPLLETTIYQRLADQPGIQIIQEQDVVGLTVDKPKRRVTGVWLRSRRTPQAKLSRLGATLVVDASGRNSQAPQWLAGLGYTPPWESLVNSFTGYASRLYQQPAQAVDQWKTLYIRPTPPNSPRGGLIIPIEGNRWYVTLVGMNGDYPPTDEAGFLEFARALPTPHFYEAIKEAEPLTKTYGYRLTTNRLHHYDKLPRYLEGFLVCGDAVCALNPVYAQGMTLSALGSLVLDHCLQTQLDGHLTGLAERFQQELSEVTAGLWKMATRDDRRWPSTEIAEYIPHRRPARSQTAPKRARDASATYSAVVV